MDNVHPPDETGEQGAFSDVPRRKRTSGTPKGVPAVSDPLAYGSNKSSVKARRIITITENLAVDIWFDKHYYDRLQHGDDYGQREGIDEDTVRALVVKAIPHLLFYSATISLFTFLNKDFDGTNRALRVVLQQKKTNDALNVVIEAHFIRINFYEITVKTAICKDEFELSDGQYLVSLEGNSSTLLKKEKNRNREIYSIF